MKRFILIFTFITFAFTGISKEYKVYGPQGGLAMEVTLPALTKALAKDSCLTCRIFLCHGT